MHSLFQHACAASARHTISSRLADATFARVRLGARRAAPLETRRDRVVIVGGGAGGLELATALGRAPDMDVTLVDRSACHLWKPRLHEVAAGRIGGSEEELSYLALAEKNNFRFRMGALIALDPEGRTISIGPLTNSDGVDVIAQRTIGYDRLVLAFGSQVNDFGIPGVTEYCHMLDSSEQALAFSQRLLEAAVQASEGVLESLQIGIVGAGATGVELAAELHRTITAMARFGGLTAIARLDITLIDLASRVLPNNDPCTSAFALQALQRLGVKVRLGAGVERVTADGFVLRGGEHVPCQLKVWASGVIGRPVAAQLSGLQIDRARRIMCDNLLRCAGASNIFALGDCAVVLDPASQKPLPATAQVAHQQAAYLARIFPRYNKDNQPQPFSYRPMGSLVSLGTQTAAGEIPASKTKLITLSGAAPKVLYLTLQLTHRAAILRWSRAIALTMADYLRNITAPPVKLH